MSRSILLVSQNGARYSSLRHYFRDMGDQIQLANSMNRFKEMVQGSRPSLVVVDVGIFGNGWSGELDSFRQTNSQLPILFTADQDSILDEAQRRDYEASGVLIDPCTTEQIEAHLQSAGLSATRLAAGARQKGRLKKIHLSVQTKITAPYVLLALLLAMIGAYLATRVIFETTRDKFTNQLIETRKLASLWISQEEEVLLEALRLFANTQGIPAAIADSDTEHLRDMLFPLAVNAGTEALEILDLQGVSVLSMRHIEGGRIEDYEFSKGGDEYTAWPIVSLVMEQYSDTSGDKYSAIVQASWGNYLYISGPIYAPNGRLAGVILVGDSLATMIQSMRESTMGQISIYELSGQLLDTTMMLEPGPLVEEVISSILSRQDSESLARVHSISDIDYEELLGPLELRGGRDEAILGTSLPQNFLVQANSVTRIQVFSLATGGTLLIVLLGVAISKTLTRPLINLTKATSRVSEGDLNVQVRIEGDDEIASLAHSFNSMIGAIKDSKVQLTEAHNHVINAYDLTIMGWARALELRDKETVGHCHRVTEMTAELAKALGIEDDDLINIRRGALLHDIGKMGISDAILLKPGPLNDEEWEEMRKHPIYAYELIREIEYLRHATDIPYAHHEKWDGSGYPRGLKGEAIPFPARIFAVVDVWDALSSDRPYRDAWPRDKIIRYMESCRGSHFDPRVLDAFLELIADESTVMVGVDSLPTPRHEDEEAMAELGSSVRGEEHETVAAV